MLVLVPLLLQEEREIKAPLPVFTWRRLLLPKETWEI
jgi:hypothetical protein